MQETREETEDSMFKVTPMEDESLLQFKERAEADGYAVNIVDLAVEKAANKHVKSYQEFEDVIDSVISGMEMEQAENTAKEERIRRSTRMEVSRLCKISNIAEYADTCIYNTYQTHSVSIMDILRVAPEEKLDLDLYQEPIYSIIIQINKPWVSDIVHDVMDSWSTKDYPKKFVEDYLRSTGVSEDEFEVNKNALLDYLSDDYIKDTAPIEYKQFKAVQQILQQSRTDYAKTEQAILSNQDSLTEYSATFELELESGMPVEAASASATEAASDMLDSVNSEEVVEDSGNSSISSKAGAFCGKVLRFKYQTAKNFEDMMYESLGEFASAYKENKEAIRERKDALRKQKADYKLKQQEIQLEREKQQAIISTNKELYEHDYDRDRYHKSDEYRRDNRRNKRDDYDDYDESRRDRRRGGNSRDLYADRGREKASKGRNLGADRIPTPVIVFVVNLIAGLILWLLLGKFYATFAVVGLGLSFVGVVTLPQKKRDAIVMILVGYLMVLLAIYLNFKVR